MARRTLDAVAQANDGARWNLHCAFPLRAVGGVAGRALHHAWSLGDGGGGCRCRAGSHEERDQEVAEHGAPPA